MTHPLHVRLLGLQDLPFADHLRALANWNQTLTDWRRFLQMEPEGCFLAEWSRLPVGTVTTLVHGPELAWVGMLLVHPDYRRRGIGSALLDRCLRHLRDRRVCCVKLDATPMGQRVYEPLGFRAEWTFTRWQHSGLRLDAAPSDGCTRLCRTDDTPRMASLDVAAFGVSRQRLLHALVAQSERALVLETPPGHAQAYGLLRQGAQALYLGPITACSPGPGLAVTHSLLAQAHGRPVFWDIPDQNTAAIDWARQHGFTAQRNLTRMYLGDPPLPGKPLQQFALAGPELG